MMSLVSETNYNEEMKKYLIRGKLFAIVGKNINNSLAASNGQYEWLVVFQKYRLWQSPILRGEDIEINNAWNRECACYRVL